MSPFIYNHFLHLHCFFQFSKLQRHSASHSTIPQRQIHLSSPFVHEHSRCQTKTIKRTLLPFDSSHSKKETTTSTDKITMFFATGYPQGTIAGKNCFSLSKSLCYSLHVSNWTSSVKTCLLLYANLSTPRLSQQKHSARSSSAWQSLVWTLDGSTCSTWSCQEYRLPHCNCIVDAEGTAKAVPDGLGGLGGNVLAVMHHDI